MMGSEYHLHVQTEDGTQLVVRIPTINLSEEERATMVMGSKINITFEGKAMHFFDVENERNLLVDEIYGPEAVQLELEAEAKAKEEAPAEEAAPVQEEEAAPEAPAEEPKVEEKVEEEPQEDELVKTLKEEKAFQRKLKEAEKEEPKE